MEEKIIDFEDALDRVQDDKELLFELFDIFEQDFQKKRKEIEKAITAQDIEGVQNLAHSLKGASANISAHRIQALCLWIEKTSADGTLQGVEGRLPELDQHFDEYLKEAENIREDHKLL